MPIEPAVFLQEECVDQSRRHLRERCPQPVLIVRGQCDPKQLAVGRPHGSRERNAFRQRRVWPQAYDHEHACDRNGRLLHGFTISSFPAKLVPVTLRSYMPSAKAGGAWNAPALVA